MNAMDNYRLEYRRIAEYSWVAEVRDEQGILKAVAEAQSPAAALKQLVAAEAYRARRGTGDAELLRWLRAAARRKGARA